MGLLTHTATTSNRSTPLTPAGMRDRVEAAKLPLQRKAAVHRTQARPWSRLAADAKGGGGGRVPCAKRMLAHGITSEGQLLCIWAAGGGLEDVVALLREARGMGK